MKLPNVYETNNNLNAHQNGKKLTKNLQKHLHEPRQSKKTKATEVIIVAARLFV